MQYLFVLILFVTEYTNCFGLYHRINDIYEEHSYCHNCSSSCLSQITNWTSPLLNCNDYFTHDITKQYNRK